MSTRAEIKQNTETPDLVIKNRNTRAYGGGFLYIVSLIAAIAALVFQIFPELLYGTDIGLRAITLVNAVVSLLAGSFGIAVSTPNVPKPLS